MSRRRQVSEEERALWNAIARTVTPLRRPRKHGTPATGPAESTKSESKPKPTRSSSPHPVAATHKAAAKPQPKPQPKPKEQALAPLDRRAKQKLARGAHTIDARLDLHGRTQGEAHAALMHFLSRAQARGAKTVLVITGKGSGTGSERGVLKRQVPMWLELPEFRSLVVGFGAAATGHGGDGALYVRVRRTRA
jgi:DNA-nicking Smr family endonuclease